MISPIRKQSESVQLNRHGGILPNVCRVFPSVVWVPHKKFSGTCMEHVLSLRALDGSYNCNRSCLLPSSSALRNIMFFKRWRFFLLNTCICWISLLKNKCETIAIHGHADICTGVSSLMVWFLSVIQTKSTRPIFVSWVVWTINKRALLCDLCQQIKPFVISLWFGYLSMTLWYHPFSIICIYVYILYNLYIHVYIYIYYDLCIELKDIYSIQRAHTDHCEHLSRWPHVLKWITCAISIAMHSAPLVQRNSQEYDYTYNTQIMPFKAVVTYCFRNRLHQHFITHCAHMIHYEITDLKKSACRLTEHWSVQTEHCFSSRLPFASVTPMFWHVVTFGFATTLI